MNDKTHITNDELFQNYIDYINNFEIKDIVQKSSDKLGIALIDTFHMPDMKQLSTEERLTKLIIESHKILVSEIFSTYVTLISDYNTWLMNNYGLVEKPDV